MTHWRCRRVLVLCPKAVLGVWRREMATHCGLSHNVCVLDSGTSQGKAVEVSKAMAHADNVMTTMVAVNYDTFWRDPLLAKLRSIEWDLLILDESHRAKSPVSKAGKAAFDLSLNARRKYC